MTDQLDADMRARLDAELDAEAGHSPEQAPTAPDGLFSLGQIALAGLFGAGFGGIVLAVKNDRRLGTPPWRTIAGYLLVLLASIALIAVALPPDMAAKLRPLIRPAIGVLGPVAVAWTLQGDVMVGKPSVANPTRPILIAIGIGWLCALAFWVPLGLLLAP